MKDPKLLGSMTYNTGRQYSEDGQPVYVALIQVSTYHSCFYFNDSARHIAGLIETHCPGSYLYQRVGEQGLREEEVREVVQTRYDFTDYAYSLWTEGSDGGFSVSEANRLTKEDRQEQFEDIV